MRKYSVVLVIGTRRPVAMFGYRYPTPLLFLGFAVKLETCNTGMKPDKAKCWTLTCLKARIYLR